MIAVPPTLSPLAAAVGWLGGDDRLMIAVPPTLSPLAAAVGGQSRESRDRPLVEESPTRGRRSRGQPPSCTGLERHVAS
jgi:hypothetical protein